MKENERLPEGVFVVGNTIYGKCRRCGKIVRLNKPVLGSLHFCEANKP